MPEVQVLTPEQVLAALLAEGTQPLEPVALRQASPVAAGAAGAITVTEAAGKGSVHRTPIAITSTYYDPAVTITLLLDPGGDQRNLTPVALPLTGPVSIEPGAAVLQRVGLRLDITNSSLQPAIVTLASTRVQMPLEYALNAYLPILAEMRRRIEGLLAAPLWETLVSRFGQQATASPLQAIRERFQTVLIPTPAPAPGAAPLPLPFPLPARLPALAPWQTLRKRFPPLMEQDPEQVLRR
jgi:hypothetical protein